MRKFILYLALCTFACLSRAGAEPSQVAIGLPAAMQETGLFDHIIPRFQFRSQIRLVPTAPDPNDRNQILFTTDTGKGTPLLISRDGTVYALVIPEGNQSGEKIRDWLLSAPGTNAVQGFPKSGPPLFRVFRPNEAPGQTTLPAGDIVLGSELALKHCGRCHVIGARNRMGGIGSTPSFGALRARDNWQTLFRVFWAEPPHPSFTLIPGMTEEFTKARPAHIAPVRLTLDEVHAIIAFVASIPPKDLGRPLRFN